ncbi:UDP-N-acetylglucosamine 1-carboxyvinyltransferase [candidate division KSB1 bacterium]|nr:UDP-N-acetylglucosamine 1-carboxyvinyltransferase [candidate division KSB1 bacterium]NIR73353.1 UDP-N-acetylglucosamine 1-carboxyvinyltransferase [candidate division KSB1 bacterium]NIS25233.1 UDP-N-acetylglucosamine 1-carboxyvinyltransferase [candidate division KSB1 bacterium]NIT72136.1 UDP-N-acetylglucosamine 1-carboxyvinyltransferase [candidate division KSB1 bacterium]NIU25942.1 UDP-N-acetylglucosamine 1-carboxyvinyltransferase [candidate division KSB1 bacterium]
MDKIVIKGPNQLKGSVQMSGAKNAVLPIMAATLLASGKFEIRNVPNLRDVKTMAHLLRIIGAQVEYSDHKLRIDSSNCNFFEAPYELVKTMRASVYVLGPLLARFAKAKVSLPGGCAIGTRPVDLHIRGLQQLGANIELKHGYMVGTAEKLRGAHINFDISSVGATGNILMAAVLSDGRTVIENAAREPEITNLAKFLQKMGAEIEGVGTSQLQIHGVKELSPVDFDIIPDRIEAATFLLAAAISSGEIVLNSVDAAHVGSLIAKLREAGVYVEEGQTSIFCKSPERIKPVNITTAPYPGFPTDLQAQWMALMCLAHGSSVIRDNIFVDRFTHVAELRRLGAQIELSENVAVVKGVPNFNGASLMSTDLRASASLILAGLAARGRTEVLRVYHIDRGYETIEKKLENLGADIWREEGSY